MNNGMKQSKNGYSVYDVPSDFGAPLQVQNKQIVIGEANIELRENNNCIETISVGQAREDLEKLQKLCVSENGDYRKALDNMFWKRAYKVESRNFAKLSSNGHDEIEDQESIPCHYCGLYVPIKLITIDHKIAQKGPVGFLMIKVLSLLDRSYAQDLGSDAQQYVPPAVGLHLNNEPAQYHLEKSVIPLSSRFFFTPVGVDHHHLKNVSPKVKLTNTGIIFLSYLHIKLSGKLINTFLSSMMNLAPGCSSCNPRKGALLYQRDWVWPVMLDTHRYK